MNTVNVPLLRKVVEWAEAEAAKPREISEWEQSMWESDPHENLFFDPNAVDYIESQNEYVKQAYKKSDECGTCYCIAGYTASITLRPGETMRDGRIYLNGKDVCHSSDRAIEELGLPVDKYDFMPQLFDAANTIEDVRRIAEGIAGERL